MNETLVADVYKLYGTASMSIPADSPLEEVIHQELRQRGKGDGG